MPRSRATNHRNRIGRPGRKRQVNEVSSHVRRMQKTYIVFAEEFLESGLVPGQIEGRRCRRGVQLGHACGAIRTRGSREGYEQNTRVQKRRKERTRDSEAIHEKVSNC